MREVRAETNLQWRVAERWTVFAVIQQGRLLNDAANGPLTRSKNQTGFGLGFGYRFTGGN
jgi:outer membrane scaffolding protein for murein synthesis (MipA/OmpV family)